MVLMSVSSIPNGWYTLLVVILFHDHPSPNVYLPFEALMEYLAIPSVSGLPFKVVIECIASCVVL